MVSSRGIKVDKAKIEVIEKMPPPTIVKEVRSFLGHARFYKHFIKDFSKIAKPLSNLLCHDVPFLYDKDYVDAFYRLKKVLTSAPIMQPPKWNLPFEIMCNASDYAISVALGQRKDKKA